MSTSLDFKTNPLNSTSENKDNKSLYSTISSKLKPPSSADASISHLQIGLLIFYISIILILGLVITLVPSVKNSFYDLLFEINANMSFKMIVYLFLVGLVLTLIGFPISLYEMSLGFMIDDYFLAVATADAFKIIGTLLHFLFARFVFKDKFEIVLKNSLIFKAIQRGTSKNPWKTLIFLKVISIPQIIKNYGLGITDVSVYKFFIVDVFTCSIYAAVWVYFGSEMKSLNEVFHATDRSNSYNWVKYSLLGVNVVLIIVLFIAGKIYFDEIKSEIKKEEDLGENTVLLHKDNKPYEYGTLK